ncbi:MAG: murein biosynthesis integral membrane protein MurJ [Phycisphaerae bacterium]|nr:murein biosynthesis integral membrane protein MurJ [Phycisphaerae bacterium]MBM91732.1 murein biosynthesis integral membrane protein MurJ [Phycisphaerae bacterium]
MSESASNTSEGSIGRDTRTVAGLTLVSRVLGLVRDVVTVRVFGDTFVGSAFAAAFAVPNMFRRLFGEGALSAAFLPEYTRLADGDPEKADAFASLTIGLLALVTGVLTLLIELGLLAVVLYSADDPERAYSLKLVMVMLPFMPVICVAAILGGMLQSHGRFGPWAAAPILLNLCIIASAVPYFFVEGASAAAWAYPVGIAAVVSAVLQVAWSLWALRGTVRWTTGVSQARREAKLMLLRMIPVLIGLGTLQLNSFADTLIAMYPNWVGDTVFGYDYPLDASSNAILFYAQRLYQFPLGVFGIAVATAAFPALSRVAGDSVRFGEMLTRGLRLSLFIGVPASVGLLLVGEALIRVLYSGGGDGFSEAGVSRASAVLAGYALAVWAYSLNQLLTRAFYARGDTRTPMTVALGMVGVNICLNLVLIWWLREAGLAWSTAVCAVGQTVLLLWMANRKMDGGLRLGEMVRPVMLIVAGSGAMGLCVWGMGRVVDSGAGWGRGLLSVVVMTLTGAVVYGLWSIWMKMDELGWLIAKSTSVDPGPHGGTNEEPQDEA